ncbi:MAG: metallophosphoesterase [Mangrovibacterium sp.]
METNSQSTMLAEQITKNMKFRLVMSCLLSIVFSQNLKAEEKALLTKPYLQNVTPSGITIMWEASERMEGVIYYGSKASKLNDKASAINESTNADTYIFKARLEGLKADTKYYYQLVGEGYTSEVQEFKTAPKKKKPSFVVGIWGDSHYANPWRSMADFMVEGLNVDLAFSSGDISNSGNKREDIAKVFLPHVCERVGSRVPFYASLGNHDVGARWGGGNLIRQYFDIPSTQQAASGSYLLMYGNVAFISMDWSGMDTELLPNAWLEKVLASEQVQSARFRFIFIHNAPFYERWQVAEKEEVQRNLPLLASKYKVSAVFSGHMHGYERTFLDGVNYITQGGGSYMDIKEPVGPKLYENMLIGTNKVQNPEGFNDGMVNHMLSLHVEGEKAFVKLHYFNKEGEYLGVMETVELD